MKSLIILLSLYFIPSDTLYKIKMKGLDGNSIDFSSYKSTKLIIAEIDASKPDLSFILFLDSIQKTHSAAKLFIIPALDFSNSYNNQELVTTLSSLKTDLIITEPVLIKKTTGSKQHPLFHWLTNASENIHFDQEVDMDGRIYIINEQGILNSILSKNTPRQTIVRIINQHYSE